MTELDEAELERIERRDELQRAWLSLTLTKEGRLVLADLRLTCRPEGSPLGLRSDGSVDIPKTMVRIGHQEVWLQVMHRMGLTHEQLSQKILETPKETS